MTDEAQRALQAAGLGLSGSTGGGTLGAAGGVLPRPDRHYVGVRAENKDDAITVVRDALPEDGAFGDFEARELN